MKLLRFCAFILLTQLTLKVNADPPLPDDAQPDLVPNDLDPILNPANRARVLGGFIPKVQDAVRSYTKIRPIETIDLKGGVETNIPGIDMLDFKFCTDSDDLVSNDKKVGRASQKRPAFMDRIESVRLQVAKTYNGLSPAKREIFWEAFMSCVAFAESGDKWTKAKNPAAWSSNGVGGHTVYGFFQFAPSQKGGGNLVSCARRLGFAKSGPDGYANTISRDLAVKLVSQPDQDFNIRCGVHKIAENLALQQQMGESCLSPFRKKPRQHFGTLQDVPENDGFFACAEKLITPSGLEQFKSSLYTNGTIQISPQDRDAPESPAPAAISVDPVHETK